jgi:hypothetical protein
MRVSRRRCQRRRRAAWGAVAAAVALVLAACSSAGPGHGQGAGSRATGVAPAKISALRSLFNRDNGHTRLILIFSPT